MISYKELRIDNLVKRNDMDGVFSIRALCKDQVHPISLIDHDFEKNVHYSCECTLSELEPIPLTAEWIERFGGKKLRGVPFYEIDMNRNIGQIHINPENGMIFLRHHRNPQTSLNPMSDNTYYVHQIQNLYFALTGEELTMKETV